MFLYILPVVANKLTTTLPVLVSEQQAQECVKKAVEVVLTDPIYGESFAGLENSEFKPLIYRQVSHFRSLANDCFKQINLSTYETDNQLLQVFSVLVGYLNSFYLNSTKSFSDSCKQGWHSLDSSVPGEITEGQWEQLDGLSPEKTVDFLFYFSKAIEQVVQEIEELRADEIINLVYVDSEYQQVSRDVSVQEAVALLKIDPTTETAYLKFSKNAGLINKRSAQRVATSIIRSGFELPDHRKVGVGYQLEINEDEYF